MMEQKLLPYLQILLAIVFGLIGLFAPYLVHSLRSLILIATLAGLAVGVVTLRIGVAILCQNKVIVYPFERWSFTILRLFFGAQSVIALKDQRRPPFIEGALSHARQKRLGIASLVLGGIASLAGLAVIWFMFTQF